MRKIFNLIGFCFLWPGFYQPAASQNIHALLREEAAANHLRPSVLAGASLLDSQANITVGYRAQGGKSVMSTAGFSVGIQKSNGRLYFRNLSSGQQWVLDSIFFGQGNFNLLSKAVRIKQEGKTWKFILGDGQSMIALQPITANILKVSIIATKEPANAAGNEPGLRIRIKAGGSFYGGGERFLSSKLNGRSFSNQPHDHAWIPSEMRRADILRRDEPTYLPIPFVFTAQGSGLYVDEVNSTQIDLQKSAAGRIGIDVQGSNADLYLFAGESPKSVLSAYTSLVGRVPLAPEWAFGVWLNLRKGRDSVLYRANFLRQAKIPVDAIWIFDFDDPESNTGWTYWTNGYFGDLRTLNDSLHALNFKVLTYLRSFVNRRLSYYDFPNPIYEYCKKNDLLMKADELDRDLFSDFNSNDQVNFFNPKTDGCWQSILSRNLKTEDFDGWMEDFGDVSYVFDRKRKEYEPMHFHLDSSYSSLTNEQIANVYPLIYHKLTYEESKALKPDKVAFSRSGSAGSAAYSAVIWGGDQEPSWDKLYGYPSAITAGISAGLSGYGVWTPDILCLSPSRELWKRWVQFGALTPIMRDHLWDYQPDHIRIWTDSASIQYFTRYANLHQKLRNYIYQCAKECAQTGIPVIRHLMLEYPKDTTTYNLEYEYMLGNQVLVAPVVEEGKTTQRVYLPEGEWRFYWNRKTYHGGRWVTVDAPVDDIPFFVRNGFKDLD